MNGEDFATSLQDYIESVSRKRELEKELRAYKERIKALESEIVEGLIAAGIQSVTKDNHTIYLSSHVSVTSRTGNYADLADILRDKGLESMCTVNHARLRAWVAECHQDGGTMDNDIANAIDVDTHHRLNCRKA